MSSADCNIVCLFIVLTLAFVVCSGATCSYDCTVDDADLSCWRENIDVFSNIILDAVNQRVIVANHIGEWKRKRALPIFDPSRANAVLDGIVARNQGPMPDESMRIIFDNIVNQTTIYEENFKGTPAKYACPVPCLYDGMQPMLVAVIIIQTVMLVVLLGVAIFLITYFKRHKVTTEPNLMEK
ncbi:uncharacterized protein LOC135498284 [Lineus longissimus]|uniref:uncharacterized protein LOC135498284 n=1 Tax=Lineus longissimus TaxID=88925 RepID=UPI002B4D2258